MDLKLGIALMGCVMMLAIHTSKADAIDYMLLLDSSDNSRSSDFDSEKRFAAAFARHNFKHGNQIGLLTFGSSTHQQFSLKLYQRLANMQEAIQYMWFSPGDGNVAPAINTTIVKSFTAHEGDRVCVPNILIILTHSNIADAAEASRLAKMLDDRIIRTFVLDMSPPLSNDNFVVLTNDSSRVIRITDFSALEASVNDLNNKINSDLPRSGCGILTPWEKWTECSRLCGSGLRFRTRLCDKTVDTDKNCAGDLSEDEPCSEPVCTVILDGAWSNWLQWSSCSTTCNNGTQTRTRFCDEPIPTNGGKRCAGTDRQTRGCSQWRCPDCQRQCPAGGKLSQDCQTCLCSSASLYGRVLDTTNAPVKQADIFLESRRNNQISITDDWGYFNASGICLMNEAIFIEAKSYSNERFTPYAVNASHWTVNATLLKYVPPLFSVQPHDKVRMVGQSMTLCCEAVGTPAPASYTWLKDGIELENQRTDGKLTFGSITVSDEGIYTCSVETEAGISVSDEADVNVKASQQVDTCSAPTSKIQTLPNGCHITGDASLENSLDVKTCGKAACMTSLLHDNGTCSDWWPQHCCSVGDIELVNITCEGYTYQTTRVKTCKCIPCVVKTIISGRVYGKKDGKELPFQLGEVKYNGRRATTTNMAGYYRFEVEKGIKRIITTFHDGAFRKFIDGTRIIEVTEGSETSINVVLPLKPDPMPFTASIGLDVAIGGDQNGMAAAGSISLQENALMTADGHPYDGPAKASVHFMDPRKLDDIETANGDFVYEDRNGDKLPLRTFGMFHVGVEDDTGNALGINKPITFSLDASLFNVSLDKDGNPDLALWYYDDNKGIWVEQAKMQFSTSGSNGGRRRLLANVMIGTVAPQTVKIMNPLNYVETTKKVWTGTWSNCDQSVKIYQDITTMSPVPKKGACVVSVSVYTDFTLKEKQNQEKQRSPPTQKN